MRQLCYNNSIAITGVKRPPALYCTNDDEISHPFYEIALTEPLHDFKTVISKVLNELPNATIEKPLKESLAKLLSEIHGKLQPAFI